MTLITFKYLDSRIPPGAAGERLERLLRDPALSSAEKRSTLSGWASDANAVEERPWLRQIPGSTERLPLAAILAALQRLDDDDPPPRGGAVIRLPRHNPGEQEAPLSQPDGLRRSARRRHCRGQRRNQSRAVAASGLRRCQTSSGGGATAAR